MIKVLGVKYEKFNFPVGEISVKITPTTASDRVYIFFDYENDSEIIELLMICNALKHQGFKYYLTMDYVPFSRQDRITEPGTAFSLEVFCELINSCGATKVMINDPHSDVTPALLKNCVVRHQWEFWFKKLYNEERDYYLVAPDAGSMKKIYELASKLDYYNIIECSKHRDPSTGKISGVRIHTPEQVSDLGGKLCYIIDDICDGGRTFIEIAKELRRLNADKVILLITHGFFTKGLEVFDGLIDEIYTLKGKVK